MHTNWVNCMDKFHTNWGLIWFWETTMTVISYCLKNGRLVLVSYPERGLRMRLDWYQSHYICSIQTMSSWHQVTSKFCCWVIWHDLWPLVIKILVQILSLLLSPESSPESRVQVLYCLRYACFLMEQLEQWVKKTYNLHWNWLITPTKRECTNMNIIIHACLMMLSNSVE